jgi:hypothetical protein
MSLALPHSLKDIVSEYKIKSESLNDEIREFTKAQEKLNMAVQVIGGFNGETIVGKQYPSETAGQRILLSSTWLAIYYRLGLDNVFSADDKRKFHQSLVKPAELTLENLQATFGKYWENPRYYILKGLAEAFCKLDKFYKSHSNFGVGVKGLPKRVIIQSFGGYGSWGSDQLKDMCEAMLQVSGAAKLSDEERDLVYSSKLKSADFELERLGISVRCYQNGNAHAYFDARALKLINEALHEFYGDVLPDAEDKGERTVSTAVSKDLQFYPTPRSVIDYVLKSVSIPPGSLVLEPSCGDGAILDVLKSKGFECYGVEVHPGRAKQARGKGHNVYTANFLEMSPTPIYDVVVMNPPFYGRHYLKHIEQAKRFLKPRGLLVSILPATAWYEHGEVKGQWHDLPIGSFRESGTNVNTGFIVIRV